MWHKISLVNKGFNSDVKLIENYELLVIILMAL